jgi:hypothetical protein
LLAQLVFQHLAAGGFRQRLGENDLLGFRSRPAGRGSRTSSSAVAGWPGSGTTIAVTASPQRSSARVTGPAPSKSYGPCSPSTSCCAWRWSPPWRHGPAPTPTAPASPPPSRRREELTAARGICPDGPADLPGVIGRAVLATLLPARRPRFSARKVKCATSRYLNRDDGRPHAVTAITAIDVTVRTPPLSAGRPRRYTPARPRPPQPPTRRELITAIITSQPPRAWSGHELALRLQVKPRNMLTQLGEWTRLGFFTRTGFGTYALNTPPRPASSTTAPDP